MKKGKALEQMIKAIRDHLNNSPDITVVPNAKLTDSCGIEREIDVLVNISKQGETKGIAFECRDHNRKVGVFDIDAFATKYDDLPQITKRIVVSTAGFTKQARQKAKHHNIELHSYTNVPYAEILNFVDVYRIKGKIEVPLQFYIIAEDNNTPLIYCGQKVFNIKDDTPVNIELNIIPFILSWISHIHDKLEAQHTNSGRVLLPFVPPEKWYFLDPYNEKHIVKELCFIVDASLNAHLLDITEQKQYSTSSVRVSKYEQTDNKDLILINDEKSYSAFLQGEDETINKAPIVPQFITK